MHWWDFKLNTWVLKIIEWEVVAMISRRTSGVPKEDVVSPRLLHSDSRCSETCRQGSQACRCCSQACRGRWQACCWRSRACCWRSQACHQFSQACHWHSQVLPGAPKVLSGAPSCSQTYHNHSYGTPVPVIRDPSYSEGQLECPLRVWYSPEIDASNFTPHILSDTPGGSHWLKYILRM